MNPRQIRLLLWRHKLAVSMCVSMALMGLAVFRYKLQDRDLMVSIPSQLPQVGEKEHSESTLHRQSSPKQAAGTPASVTAVAVRQRQQQRQSAIAEWCEVHRGKIVVSSNWHYKLNQRNKYLFCPIPKSGWSSWKRLWHYTSGLISSYATDVGTGSDVKAGVMDVRGTLAIKRAYAQQQYSYSFVFVRDPWERLVSAYINKAVDYNYSRILHQPCKWESMTPYKPDITFKQFLECIASGSSSDMHWTPQTKLCNFCDVKYDFIGHMETVEEDAAAVIKSIGLNVTFPHSFPSVKHKTKQVIDTWYKDLPRELLVSLQKRFQTDFEMHGFSKRPPGRQDIAED